MKIEGFQQAVEALSETLVTPRGKGRKQMEERVEIVAGQLQNMAPEEFRKLPYRIRAQVLSKAEKMGVDVSPFKTAAPSGVKWDDSSKTLTISSQVKELDSVFKEHEAVESFIVEDSYSLSSLDGVEKYADSLKKVVVQNANRLNDISALEACRRLESVALKNCGRLEFIDALGKLPALKELDISGTHIRKLPENPMPQVEQFKHERVAVNEEALHTVFPNLTPP